MIRTIFFAIFTILIMRKIKLIHLKCLVTFSWEFCNRRQQRLLLEGTLTFSSMQSSVIERFTLVDIWRVRNQNRWYTFRQSHQAGYLQRCLDYFFVSNSLQENICETDIQVAFCTDHSPITFSLKPINNLPRGRSLWKFNNSLLQNVNIFQKWKP